MIYKYPDGVRNDDGSWKIRPVYYILFFSMRLAWAEVHHLYWGILAMIGGAYRFVEGHQIEGAIEFLLGLWWAIDDLYQHWRQLIEYDPLYHSPVHNLYGKYLYRFNFIRALNDFASWVFHLFRK